MRGREHRLLRAVKAVREGREGRAVREGRAERLNQTRVLTVHVRVVRACISRAGFQLGSNITTLFALVRFKPVGDVHDEQ
jgi:hypothetical protein